MGICPVWNWADARASLERVGLSAIEREGGRETETVKSPTRTGRNKETQAVIKLPGLLHDVSRSQAFCRRAIREGEQRAFYYGDERERFSSWQFAVGCRRSGNEAGDWPVPAAPG